MKVLHPNIHIVSNYMDFSEDVRHISSRLGRESSGARQSVGFTLHLTPHLGESEGGVLVFFVLGWAFMGYSVSSQSLAVLPRLALNSWVQAVLLSRPPKKLGLACVWIYGLLSKDLLFGIWPIVSSLAVGT
jgi:hypothetical protein